MGSLATGDRTATYARVSTADQSPNLQHDGLRAFADLAGLSVRKIHAALVDERGGEAGVSRSAVGRTVKEARAG